MKLHMTGKRLCHQPIGKQLRHQSTKERHRIARQRLIEILSQKKGSGPNVRAVLSEPVHSSDLKDTAAANATLEVTRSCLVLENLRVRRAKFALERMEEGTYDICLNDRCGCVIPEKRHDACPEALFCTDCQTAVDAKELPEFATFANPRPPTPSVNLFYAHSSD